MKERDTHNSSGSEWLVRLANGQGDVRLVQMQGGIAVGAADGQIVTVLMMRNVLPERVLAGLRAFASELIDRILVTVPTMPLVWGERVSFSVLRFRDGKRLFEEMPGGFHWKALPGWKVAQSFTTEEMDDVLVLFNTLLLREEVSAIDPGKLGKCPVCDRYFVSRGTGQRKSRACSRGHQAILAARKYRKTPVYQEKGKNRNAGRMRVVREAERLVEEWIVKEFSRECRQKRLESWNKERGFPLGEKVMKRILGVTF